MNIAPLPADESEQLLALAEYDVLDTARDPLFDGITELAAQICDAPIALISLLECDRQCFKSTFGLDGTAQATRAIAFCSHAILGDELMEVPDALHDSRFHDNPLVLSHPRIRFYGGMPLRNERGLRLGVLGVIDHQARRLSQPQRRALDRLSRLAVSLLEQGRIQRHLSRSEERFELAVRGANVGIWDWDIRENRLYASPRLLELLGHEAGEAGEAERDFPSWAQQVHADDRQRLAALVRCARAQPRQPFDVSFRLRRKAGDYTWVNVRGITLCDPQGRALRMAGSLEDISARLGTEAAARECDLRFKSVVHATKDVIWDWDIERDQLWWSANYSRMFGHSCEGLQSSLASWAEHLHPDDRQRVVSGRCACLAGDGSLWTDEYSFRVSSGEYVYVFDRAHVMRDSHGRAVRMIGCMVDLTGRREAEKQLLERERRQSLIAELGQRALVDPDPAALMAQAVGIVSGTLHFEHCRVLVRAAGDSGLVVRAAVGGDEPGVGQTIAEDDPRTQALRVLAESKPVEFERPVAFEQPLDDAGTMSAAPAHAAAFVRGVEVPIPGPLGPLGVLGVHAAGKPAVTADVICFLQSIANIIGAAMTRRQADEQLAYLAQFDGLTGLPNRHLFRDRTSQALARAERSGHSVAVLMLNLDRFKVINDSHGRSVGDDLLTQVARRLTECVDASDTVSRVGGDEYGIVLSDIERLEDTARRVQCVLGALARPFQLTDGEIFGSASAGIALYPADGTDADVLIKHAEIALHRAKEQGGGYQFYAPQMNQRALARLRLESSLRHALDRGEFLLHYQPKLDLASGATCGTEALLRWNHPQRGLVAPAEFIPVLEETGLIVPVGSWVLEAVCAQIQAWQAAGIRVLPVAVNLSARQFQRTDLALQVRRIIESYAIAPARIELEITESMLMHDPHAAAQTLGELRRLGVTLAIDDFGTGYSSLSYLKQFPLHALKIAGTFIRSIADDSDDAAIALAIINLAHNLNLQVVAEGVETEAQLRFLIDHGCDAVQGFHISRPVDAETYAKMIREGSPGLSAGRTPASIAARRD